MSIGQPTSKPKPTPEQALCLIYLRRERAKGVLSDILHGFAGHGTMPTAHQMLDYLTNTIQCLEMMLKLLSEDWKSHNVGEMYEKVTGKAHPNTALMAALKGATMSQKYLLSPAAGIIDHIPELEALGAELHARLREKYGSFFVQVVEDLPDSFSHFLLDNFDRFYRSKPVSVPPAEMGMGVTPSQVAEMKAHQEEAARIRAKLGTYLSNGYKLRIGWGQEQLLHSW